VSEGFPLVALEAMAAGKPIVMTRSGGPQEILEDRRTGLLVPVGHPEALAAAIGELLANPERAAVLGKAARGRVAVHFTIEKMISEYTGLYERLLKTV
jgi:glycosyltransferase involved in cell wall biosynthesis